MSTIHNPQLNRNENAFWLKRDFFDVRKHSRSYVDDQQKNRSQPKVVAVDWSYGL